MEMKPKEDLHKATQSRKMGQQKCAVLKNCISFLPCCSRDPTCWLLGREGSSSWHKASFSTRAVRSEHKSYTERIQQQVVQHSLSTIQSAEFGL